MTVESTPENGLDALLARYVLGDVSEPIHALLDAHLELSPANRGFVCDLEALCGRAIEEIDPAPLAERDARLDAVFECGPEPSEASPGDAGEVGDPVLPRTLAAYLGVTSDAVPWKTLLPGVKQFRLPQAGDVDASLYWIRRGRAMPHHTHEGSELTLVLQGGFSDVTGHYRRGDVAYADDTVDHRPVADDDEDCICFAVVDAPLRLTGPIGRLFAPFLKR